MCIRDRNYADCVEAYIGALVIDRFSTEFNDVALWLEELSEEHFIELGPMMVKEPLNKNAKGELGAFLQFNNIGAKISYKRLNDKSPFKVEVRLGNNLLGIGDGSNVREAEQRAAMEALAQPKLIQKYSLHDIELERGMIEEADNVPQLLKSAEIPNQTPQSHHSITEEIDEEEGLTFPHSNPFLKGTPPAVLPEIVTNQIPQASADHQEQNVPDTDKIVNDVMERMSKILSVMVSEAVSNALGRPAPKNAPIPIPVTTPVSPLATSPVSVSVPAPAPAVAVTPSVVNNPPQPKMVTQPVSTNLNKTPEVALLNSVYDKEASGRLYALLGKYKLYPEYNTEQLGMTDFYTVCFCLLYTSRCV